jgi:carbohydrate kinase (thermoresistant glucokinase family)
MPPVPVFLIMGPPGSGKSTLGEALAQATGLPFADGDDLHPAANVEKMAAGIPLNDADRAPWLARIGEVIDAWGAGGGIVACSALKRRYREGLKAGRPQVRLVFLKGDPETLRARVTHRQGHFMPPALLEDQLRVLEPPGEDEDPIVIPAELPTEAQVARLADLLER